jgi:transposase
MQTLRKRNDGDRLRGEFPVGCGAGEVFRAGHETEKRACRLCEDLGVVSALLPARIIEKCLASDRIIIDTVVVKYCNHTPLHRQSMILERDLGLEISRATLDGWVLTVGELLIPMVAAMRRELVSRTCIQADETPVDVQIARGAR